MLYNSKTGAGCQQ